MNKKIFSIVLALLFVIPMFAANDGENLSKTLNDLRRNMKRDYQQMAKTKERLATNYENQHDIVDPKRGITVAFGEFDDSAVTITVKQWVLVPERPSYIDRAKELIYDTFNEYDVNIPFPQCEVRVLKED